MSASGEGSEMGVWGVKQGGRFLFTICFVLLDIYNENVLLYF